ncbi:MAG: hypothetical protein ACRDSR_26370 [Pseudonocardiaceae bacterium]
MEKLRLDLAALEIERLDIAVPGLNGGVETFGTGHASTELGQSCECLDDSSDASCIEGVCDTDV